VGRKEADLQGATKIGRRSC